MKPIDELLKAKSYKEADTIFKKNPSLGEDIVQLIAKNNYKISYLLHSIPVLYRCLQDSVCNKSIKNKMAKSTQLWTVHNERGLDAPKNHPFVYIMNRIKKMEFDAIQREQPSVLELANMFAKVLGVDQKNVVKEMLLTECEIKTDQHQKLSSWWYAQEEADYPTSVTLLQEQYSIKKNPLELWRHHLDYMAGWVYINKNIPHDLYTLKMEIPSTVYGNKPKSEVLIVEALFWNQLRGKTNLLSEKELVLGVYKITKSAVALPQERIQEMIQYLQIEPVWNKYIDMVNTWELHRNLQETLLDKKPSNAFTWYDIVTKPDKYLDMTIFGDGKSPNNPIEIHGMLDI